MSIQVITHKSKENENVCIYRMVSTLDIFPQLLSTPRDEDLVASCNQVGRWALNLFDKVVLNCASFDDLVTSVKGEKIELRDLESDRNFIVHRYEYIPKYQILFKSSKPSLYVVGVFPNVRITS